MLKELGPVRMIQFTTIDFLLGVRLCRDITGTEVINAKGSLLSMKADQVPQFFCGVIRSCSAFIKLITTNHPYLYMLIMQALEVYHSEPPPRAAILLERLSRSTQASQSSHRDDGSV